MRIDVLERGERWWNVEATSTDLDPRYYMLALVRAIVDGGRLGAFAETIEEQALFAENSIKTLATPVFTIPDSGYNSGNLLLGMSSILIDVDSLMLSCPSAAGWSTAAVDTAVPAICTELCAVSPCDEPDADADRWRLLGVHDTADGV